MAKLRESIGNGILKRKRKKISRQINVHNFDTAATAAVLFDSRDQGAFEAVKDFCHFLAGKNISFKSIGYAPQKELPQEMLFTKGFTFIQRGNMNWYRKPSGEAVESLLESKVDLLFDFSDGSAMELRFLVLQSDAAFKVGCFAEDAQDYDLMIDLGEKRDMVFLAEQFRRYIEMMNPVNGN